MDFVGAGAETTKLKEMDGQRNIVWKMRAFTHVFWRVVGRGNRRGLFAGKDCQWMWVQVSRVRGSPMGWALNDA